MNAIKSLMEFHIILDLGIICKQIIIFVINLLLKKKKIWMLLESKLNERWHYGYITIEQINKYFQKYN